jgi:N6-adenosine-specific RNA methylase IME4
VFPVNTDKADAIEVELVSCRRLELFARGTPRPGWDVWGDEAVPNCGHAKRERLRRSAGAV